MFEVFNDIPWHDAELEEIIIDRKSNDLVKVKICLSEEYGGNKVTIEFIDCYHLNVDMNFGMTAPDTILYADCFSESQELTNLRNDWKQMGGDLTKLNCYRINTNSTNSIIEAYALGFRVIQD